MHNPDTDRPNKHVGILADSGSGKSAILGRLVPGRGVRAVFWDTNNDHQATGFDTLGGFIRALAKAHAHNLETGQGFRIAYTGTESPKLFELWCRGVGKFLDGSRETLVIIEELAGATETAGTARPHFKRLINQGRKYGAAIFFTTQRPQEVPKTVFSQCSRYYLGVFGDMNTRRYLADRLDFSDKIALFDRCKVGTFLEVNRGTPGAPTVREFFRKLS